MPDFEIVTLVPLPLAVYAALAFTPALDALALLDVAALEEHAPGSPRAAAVAMRIAQAHAGATEAAAAWRARARVPRAATPLAHFLSPLITGWQGASAGGGAPRCFRVAPVSRIADALRWVLRAFSESDDDAVHYDAVQLRVAENGAGPGAGTGVGAGPPCVRFFLSAEALPALAVEGCVHFEDVGTPGATQQRLCLSVTTGSVVLDLAVAPFVEAVVRPDIERMAAAACALVAGAPSCADAMDAA